MNIFNKKNIKLSNVDKILIIIITLLIVFNFTNWFCNILGIGVDCSIRVREGVLGIGKAIKKDKKDRRRREAGKQTKAYKKKQKKIRGLRRELADAREEKEEAEDNLQTMKKNKNAKYKVLADDVNNLEDVYDIIYTEITDGGSNFYSALGSNGDLNTDLTGVTDEYSKDMYQTSYVSSRTTDYSVDGDDIFTVNDLISKIGEFFTSIDNNTGYTNAI